MVTLQNTSEEVRLMVRTLRSCLATPGDAGQPGLIRSRLEGALGPSEAFRLRRLVHQVVAAAEENLPGDLRRIAPLTPESLQRLSADLAAARGWAPDTARVVTQIWASALGFGDLAASSWPRDEPRAVLRDEPRDADPGAAAPSRRPLHRGPFPAPAVTLPPAAVGAKGPVEAARQSGPLGWPAPPKQLARHTTTQDGSPALGVALGYAGMSFPLFVASMVGLVVVLCLPIVLLDARGFLLPLLGVLLAGVLVRRVRRGALVAWESGLEFTPYNQGLTKPRTAETFGAPWRDVQVEVGSVSTLRVGGQRVQLGPRSRAFASAVAHRAGGDVR